MRSPSRHQLPPLRQIRRLVVRRAHAVAIGMRQLRLDHIAPKPQFEDYRPQAES